MNYYTTPSIPVEGCTDTDPLSVSVPISAANYSAVSVANVELYTVGDAHVTCSLSVSVMMTIQMPFVKSAMKRILSSSILLHDIVYQLKNAVLV